MRQASSPMRILCDHTLASCTDGELQEEAATVQGNETTPEPTGFHSTHHVEAYAREASHALDRLQYQRPARYRLTSLLHLYNPVQYVHTWARRYVHRHACRRYAVIAQTDINANMVVAKLVFPPETFIDIIPAIPPAPSNHCSDSSKVEKSRFHGQMSAHVTTVIISNSPR